MRLSVVMTAVDGYDAIEASLERLHNQVDGPELEIIVPYDDSISEVGNLAERFPDVHYLAMGTLETKRSIANAAGQHELIDQRRTAGLAAATGDLVAMLEDRSYPVEDWAATAVRLHEESDHAAIGGVVENGIDRPLNWAVYFVDFSHFQLPLDPMASEYVSDVNVVYKAYALEMTREEWEPGYQETTVHWALQRAGETTSLSPELLTVQHRAGLTLGVLVAERYHWGRIFAHTRVLECGLGKRLVYALTAPVLPFLLYARALRIQVGKRRLLGKFLRVSPHVFALMVPKAVGELVGYVTGTS